MHHFTQQGAKKGVSGQSSIQRFSLLVVIHHVACFLAGVGASAPARAEVSTQTEQASDGGCSPVSLSMQAVPGASSWGWRGGALS